MDILSAFNIIFQPVVALLGIGVMGFLIARRGIIVENVVGVLSRLAIDIALPSLVFANIMLDFAPAKFPDWWQMPLWWVFFTLIILVLTLVTMFLSQKSTRGEFAISLFFQNGIFFPIIIISGVFGRESPYLVLLFLFILFHPSLYFSTYYLFFRGKGKQSKPQFNLRRILNPVMIVTVVAVAIRLAGVETYLPPFVVSIFQILGSMALPLLMLVLGGSLYIDFHKAGRLYISEILKFILVKNLVFPLAIIGVLFLVRPQDYGLALIIFLQAAVPPITGIPVVAEREGGDRAIVNQFILASFIFSIISIPALFILFNTYFPIPR